MNSWGFSRFEVGPEILYFQVPKSHCCHWSADYILRSQSIMESVLGTKKESGHNMEYSLCFFGLLAEDTFIAVSHLKTKCQWVVRNFILISFFNKQVFKLAGRDVQNAFNVKIFMLLFYYVYMYNSSLTFKKNTNAETVHIKV